MTPHPSRPPASPSPETATPLATIAPVAAALFLLLAAAAPAQYIATPDRIVIDVIEGDPAPDQTVVITGPDTGSGFGYEVVSLDGTGWVTVTPRTGVISTSATLNLSFDITGLTAGFYYTTTLQVRFIAPSSLVAQAPASIDIPVYVYAFPPDTEALVSAPEVEANVEITYEGGVSVREGESLGLFIRYYGTPPFDFQWSFSTDGIEFTDLADTTNRRGTRSSYLEIPALSLADHGFYHCTVSNEFGSDTSIDIFVEVRAEPEIFSTLEDKTVGVGDPFSLVVQAFGTPPLHYRWTKGDTEVGSDSNVFTLPSAATADAGTYTCEVTNGVGSAQSNSATLTVQTLPTILQEPSDTVGYLGEAATFHVGAVGAAPLSYLWEFSSDGTTFVPVVESLKHTGALSSALTIFDLANSDQGFYRCIVVNGSGIAPTRSARLDVAPAPGFLAVVPLALNVAAVKGTNALDSVVTLINPGGTAAGFSVETSGEAWLQSATPETGTVPPGGRISVVVVYDTAALDYGEYTASVTISPVGAEDPPVVVSIRLLVVDPFTVTTLDSDGPGSLRQVILLANQTEGPQTITFQVTGLSRLLAELPPIDDATGGTTIDGVRQFTLSGELLHGTQDGITLRSANNVLRGLVIIRFPGNGVRIKGPNAVNNRVVNCFIGTDGATDMGNLQSGILIDDGASSNTIGGDIFGDRNTISGNSFSAITIESSTRNFIRGNFLGLNAAGSGFVANGGNGIHILVSSETNNTVGGETLFDRNDLAGSRFQIVSVDILEGGSVALNAHAAGPTPYTFQWTHDGAPVGGNSSAYEIASAVAADTGFYVCEISNANGSDDSDPVYINVLTAPRYVAPKLLSGFSLLDLDLNGLLSFLEANGFIGRALQRVGRAPQSLPIEAFNALDTNGDHYLSIDELLAANPIPEGLEGYRVVPAEPLLDIQNIDDGPTSPPTTVYLQSLSKEPLTFVTTPTLAGQLSDFKVLSDTGQSTLNIFDARDVVVQFDPTALNFRAAYLEFRTDDFLLPFRPVLISGFGFQTTGQLVADLLARGAGPRKIGEVDVNEDGAFDISDIVNNRRNGF